MPKCAVPYALKGPHENSSSTVQQGFPGLSKVPNNSLVSKRIKHKSADRVHLFGAMQGVAAQPAHDDGASQSGRYLFSSIFSTASLLAGSVTCLAVLYATLSAHGGRTDVEGHPSACSQCPQDCELTAPFVFDSMHGLLKQWPNARAQNGHSIVTAHIPPNTPLFHARNAQILDLPAKPTYFSFDSEMGLGIYGSWAPNPYLHTMLTTRRLSVLYFDGSSATLTHAGTLDS